MFRSIKAEVIKFSKKDAISHKICEQNIKDNWGDIAKKVFSKDVERKSAVIHLKNNGELTVGVLNNMWLYEFSFFKEDLKKEINSKLKHKSNTNFIKNIRFVLGTRN